MTNHFRPFQPSQPAALAIAGFDPSGGAGISADLKTFAAHNCYGVAAITALTVQNTRGVEAVHPVDAGILRQTLRALLEDGPPAVIKVGMLGNSANAAVVRETLTAHAGVPSVLDPVLRSSSGRDLIDGNCLAFLRDELMQVPSVITPNTEEAAALTGASVQNIEEMKAAAKKLVESGARAVVITGGCLEKATDVYYDGSQFEVFIAERVKPTDTHGTGCTFASALASNLALGRPLRDAIVMAKVFVSEAIRKAFPTGPGRIPLHQLYRLQQGPRSPDAAIAEVEGVH